MGKFVLFLSINRYVIYLLEVFSIHFHEVQNSANIISMTMNVICTTFFLSVFQIKCPAQGFFFLVTLLCFGHDDKKVGSHLPATHVLAEKILLLSSG